MPGQLFFSRTVQPGRGGVASRTGNTQDPVSLGVKGQIYSGTFMVCMAHRLHYKTPSINIPYTQNVQTHAAENSVDVRLLTQPTSSGGLELGSRPEVN